MSAKGSPQVWAVVSAIAVVFAFDEAPETSAKEKTCSCYRDDGTPSNYATACWWSLEEEEREGKPKVLDPEDTCNWGERFAAYFVGTQGGTILESYGWAAVNCFLGTTPAVAQSTSSSKLRVRFRLNNPCSGCVGGVRGFFDPALDLCANAYAADSRATIAAAMQCRSSVADNQDRRTEVWQKPLSALAHAYNGPGEPSGYIQLPISGVHGVSLTLPLGGRGGLESTAVGQISNTDTERHYSVSKLTNWEITFSFMSALAVDVAAVDMAVLRSGAIARSGRGTWDAKLEFSCLGGCSERDECGGLSGRNDYQLQYGLGSSEPTCTKP